MSAPSTMSSPSGTQSPGRSLAAQAAPWLGVVAAMGVATHSVVRYELGIVLTYVVLAVALAWWLLAPARPTAALSAPVLGWIAGGALAVAAVLHVRVRPYTYLTTGEGWTVRWILAVATLLAAVLLVAAAHGRVPLLLVPAVAVVAYLVAAALLIHWDPRPKIDVWVSLQQAADGILHGQNIYTMNWHDSPGVQDAFTYLPFTALLLAPGRWIAGDVRWALVVVTLLGAAAVHLLSRRDGGKLAPAGVGAAGGAGAEAGAAGRAGDAGADGGAGGSAGPARIAGAGAVVLLLMMPGTPTQVEQAWTEPLLMACLAGWALGVHRRIPWLAVLCLALGLASKQHLVLLLPMLAAWRGFGWKRVLQSGLLAALFVLPWFIASPKDMIHDTVTGLINFQPLRFADTVFIAAMHELDWTPPFWITGALVIAAVVASAVLAHRRTPDLPTVLRWAALLLLVANLVNKQAFYNQYWLVAVLVVMSLSPAVATAKDHADRADHGRDPFSTGDHPPMTRG